MVKFILKVSVSAILIFILFHKINLNQLKDSIEQLGTIKFFLLCIVYLLAQLISSVRWRMVLKSLSKNENMLYLFKLYLMGMFANLFLPSTIGGDAIKGYLLAKKSDIRSAVSSIFLERYNGLLALLFLSLLSVLIFFRLFGWKITLSIAGINILSIITVYMLKFIKHPKIASFYANIEKFHKSKEFLRVSILSIFIQIINILIYFTVGKTLNYPANIAYYFAFIPIITLISFLPISFNGIGVREFSFIYFFKYAGLSAEESVSLSLIVFLITVVCSLIGGLFYLHNGRVIREAKKFHREP